jgi:hypothetical protein
VLSDTGEMKAQILLDAVPVCSIAYEVENGTNEHQKVAIISSTGIITIYDQLNILWTANTGIHPISIQLGAFKLDSNY